MKDFRAFFKSSLPRVILPYAIILTLTLTVFDLANYLPRMENPISRILPLTQAVEGIIRKNEALPLIWKTLREAIAGLEMNPSPTVTTPLLNKALGKELQPAQAAEKPPVPPTGKAESTAISQVGQFQLQAGTPLGMENFTHPELGCEWAGLGGQVFDTAGEPVTGITIEMGGELDGEKISEKTVSGAAPGWGPGGFEFTLGNHPQASTAALWIRILGEEGTPSSDPVKFDTFGDCKRNSILLNFKEIGETYIYYFPWVPGNSYPGSSVDH